MTTNDLVNHLYDELSYQHEIFFWTCGSLITIIVLVVGFYSYQQWRFSEKGIKDIKKQFGIDNLSENLEKVKVLTSKSDSAINDLNNATQKANDELINQRNEFAVMTAQIAASELENISRDTSLVMFSNSILRLNHILINLDPLKVSSTDILNILVNVSNGLSCAIDYKVDGSDWEEPRKDLINEVKEYLKYLDKFFGDCKVSDKDQKDYNDNLKRFRKNSKKYLDILDKEIIDK